MIENHVVRKTTMQPALEIMTGLWPAICATIVSAIFMIVLVYTFIISPIN